MKQKTGKKLAVLVLCLILCISTFAQKGNDVMMNKEELIKIASNILKISIDVALENYEVLQELDAIRVGNPIRGGGRVIISSDKTFLFASSSISPEEHLREFISGRRSKNYYLVENPNEISDYNKRRIENGKLKPLCSLETDDKEKYDTIVKIIQIRNLNVNINEYYYCIYSCEKTVFEILHEIQISSYQYLIPERYEDINNLPKDNKINIIEYAIYDYEALTNKHNGTLGSITDNCFSAVFNSKYGFIGTLGWE
ncbi:MAG: hypothetical protein LBH44_10730 [Treponema sp.]|jgi:hypothetical protein|nr:hypothetical protein [Treponema sp.]